MATFSEQLRDQVTPLFPLTHERASWCMDTV
jgi:hypothetical protein